MYRIIVTLRRGGVPGKFLQVIHHVVTIARKVPLVSMRCPPNGSMTRTA